MNLLFTKQKVNKKKLFLVFGVTDVKQYANLIKTLCFLLNSYKPRETVAVSHEAQGNVQVQ